MLKSVVTAIIDTGIWMTLVPIGLAAELSGDASPTMNRKIRVRLELIYLFG